MACFCCLKDEQGYFLNDPCCNTSGICEADPEVSMCIHCGGEMFEEGGFWWHHSQKDIPIEVRGTVQTSCN